MAVEYIPYERFLKEISEGRRKKTRIEYDGKCYEFWYDKGKYYFGQYLPKRQMIKCFSMYETMLSEVEIEGEHIKDLWDKDEFKYIYKKEPHPYRQIGLLGKEYRKHKKLYDTVVMIAQVKNIIRESPNIKINKELVIYIFHMCVMQWLFLAIEISGIVTIMPVDGVTIRYNDLLMGRSLSLIAQIITYFILGFLVPLLNCAPDKIKGYFTSYWIIHLLVFASILGVSINSCFSISITAGIITFFVFILCDFVSLCVGYFAYKIYYNRKLKEAEKIREEYRREHPEENVG